MVEVCHYPDFLWGDHYLPQMPLLFCVSIRPRASITTILEKSRRCLCADTHLILAINWQQLYPHTSLSGSASRPSICCCEDVWLWVNVFAYRSASICAHVRFVSGRLQKICDLWFCACWHLCSQRCSSLTLSDTMKLILKVERGDKQMWQAARCVISTNRGSIRELQGKRWNLHILMKQAI